MRALVVGASRGLGLGLVRGFLERGWIVTGTHRGEIPPKPMRELQAQHPNTMSTCELDVTRSEHVLELARRTPKATYQVIFMNAGIYGPGDRDARYVPRDEIAQVFQTNAVAPAVCADLLKEHLVPDGLMAFMSSRLGSIADNELGDLEVYRASKSALNSMVKSLAERNRDRAIRFLLIHPGWVRTDMGGKDADIDVQTSVAGMVAIIESHHDVGHCEFLDYSGRRLPW